MGLGVNLIAVQAKNFNNDLENWKGRTCYDTNTCNMWS